ncbi:hypothetical protein VIBNIBLFn1_650096 [Vibrio nigripulchritudo BLFn1]|nr:hypothetical protein VIBNIBLFn1_650096 [Vibrio nigripulchritudo BLFn1]
MKQSSTAMRTHFALNYIEETRENLQPTGLYLFFRQTACHLRV